MIRVHYCSDLHLEQGDLNAPIPEGDILILAGDICIAEDLVSWQSDCKKKESRDRAMWFFDTVSESFEHVLYCMGNHEHLDFDLYHTEDFLKSQLHSNIHLLEKQHIKIEDTIFYGATLWSDFKGANPDQIKKSGEKMPEYKYARAGKNLLTPEITLQEHQMTLKSLRQTARQYYDHNIVVISHHAPSYQGLSEYFNGTGTQGAFASDLIDIIQTHDNIKHWVFGHTHLKREFQVETCRFHTNCRGYKGHDQTAENFAMNTWFEIATETKELSFQDVG